MSEYKRNFSSMTIGILGGMGPAASANFQQLLVAELNKAGVVEDSVFPRIITLSLPLQGWDHRGAQNKIEVQRQVRQGVWWLESHGAKLVAVPCNSVHEFIGDGVLQAESKLVVDIIGETLACCASASVVGVLCSRQTRESKLYERNPSQQYIYLEDQSAIDNIVASVLKGDCLNIRPYIAELFSAGAEAVVLGCTELSLCPQFPHFEAVVDSSKALAAAVVRRLREN